MASTEDIADAITILNSVKALRVGEKIATQDCVHKRLRKNVGCYQLILNELIMDSLVFYTWNAKEEFEKWINK